MRRLIVAAVLGGCLVPRGATAETVLLGPPSLPSSPIGEFCAYDGNTSFCFGRTLANLTLPSGVLAAPDPGIVTAWRFISYTSFPRLQVIRPQTGGKFVSAGFSPTGTNGTGAPNAVSLPMAKNDQLAIYLPGGTNGTRGIAYVAQSSASYGVWEGGLTDSTPASAPGPPVNGQVLLYNATLALAPIASFTSQSSGPPGTEVPINGNHLTDSTAVMFGSTPAASFRIVDNNQIVAVAPNGLAVGTPVDITVSGPGGTSALNANARFTATTPPPADPGPTGPSGPVGGGAPAVTGSPAPAPPPDTVRPRISLLLLAPTSFRAGNIGPSVARAAPVGTRVVLRVTEAASVRFTAERAATGRRRGRACVRPTRANARARRCTRYVAVTGAFSRAATPGLSDFRFTGRLGRRALARGSYRLIAVATDAAGNRSAALRRAFRIVG